MNGKYGRLRLPDMRGIMRRLKALRKEIPWPDVGYYVALTAVISVFTVGVYHFRNGNTNTGTVDHGKEIDIAQVQSVQTSQTQPAEQLMLAPVEGEWLNGFSSKDPIWSATMGQWQIHTGVDMAAKTGEAVFAAADGVIEDVFYDPLYGNTVVLKIDNGDCVRYASLELTETPVKGQRIRRGDIIGAAGICCVEAHLGVHVHIEYYRDGIPSDFTVSAERRNNPEE